MTTNITEEHRRTVEGVTSGEHDNFAFFSCFVDNQPAAAIVDIAAHWPDDDNTEFQIEP